MVIKRYDHTAINVRSIEESLKFYRDTMGFEVMDTIDMERFAVTCMKVPDGSIIELYDYKGKCLEAERDLMDIGFKHMAFIVDNVAESEKKLREAGAPIVKPTTEYPSFGLRVVLFKDPNGVIIELCEEL